MNVLAGWKKVPAVLMALSAVSTAGLFADTASQEAAPTGTTLKWTPHRPTRLADASTASSMPPSPPEPDMPTTDTAKDSATAPTSQAAPPSRIASPPTATRPNYAPSAAVRPDQPQAPPFTLPPLRFPSVSIFARSPQGEASRPMLASGEYRPPNVYGGRPQGLSDAPPFTAQAPATARRPARFAMNGDELPSVVSRSGDPLPVPSTPAGPSTPPGVGGAYESRPTYSHEMSETIEFAPGGEGMPMEMQSADAGMWMGGYPDGACYDPYSADGCCPEDECGFFPGCAPTGRICAWLRQFGRPYYGWRWYRDFTASAGITGFEAPADLGIAGNFGVNEYANFGMPFWNAFGIGWQLGVRGVQSNFQSVTINGFTDEPFITGARDQLFLTTGFYTRAFEGRGLQFGAVWDYLRDNWYDNVDLAQLRGEISYVWNAHEIGFWGAANYDTVPFTTRRLTGNASTIDLYAAFYRLHFGDANEWKVWGGSTSNGDGLMGTLLRAPMTKSLALEGTFTYLIPKQATTYDFGSDDQGNDVSITSSDAAWNVSINVVFYPACRSRRGLASPYRPLFEVADNGSMIRSLEGVAPVTP